MVETVGTLEAALVVGLVAVGCLFLAIGTIGLLRFPNVYNRMHATSKPTTLGTAAILGAAFVRFGPAGDGLPSLLAIVFLFLTVPTGAHMIARSAERMGVPFEEGVTWPAPPGAADRADPPVGVVRPESAVAEDDAVDGAGDEGAVGDDAGEGADEDDIGDDGEDHTVDDDEDHTVDDDEDHTDD